MMKKREPLLRLVRPDLPPIPALTSKLNTMWRTGRITNFGPLSQRLEVQVSDFLGCGALAMASGTTALTATLLALDVPRGSSAVLPSFTFAATGQAVLSTGLTPVFCDVEEDGNLSHEALAQILASNPDVRVVIAVHLYGTPANVGALGEVIRTANLRSRKRIHLVYDSAHALGARTGTAMIGTFGDAEVFSLSATKPLVACEGGLVTSREDRFLQRMKLVRNYGLQSNNHAVLPGLNGKLSEVHAAIALLNLGSLEKRLRKRAVTADKVRTRIEAETSFRCIPVRAGTQPTYKDFTIRIPPSRSRQRPNILEKLAKLGIEARVYFTPPLHRQKLFRRSQQQSLPMTDELAATVLTIPFYTDMTSAEIERLLSGLKQADPK